MNYVKEQEGKDDLNPDDLKAQESLSNALTNGLLPYEKEMISGGF